MSSLNTPSNSTSSINNFLKALVLSTTLGLGAGLITSCDKSDDPKPNFEQTTDTLSHDVLNYTPEDIETYLQNHSQDQLKHEILQAFQDYVNNSNLSDPVKKRELTTFIRDTMYVTYEGNYPDDWVRWIQKGKRSLSKWGTVTADPFLESNQVLDSLGFSREQENYATVDTIHNYCECTNLASLKFLQDNLIFDNTFDKESLRSVLRNFSNFMRSNIIQAVLKKAVNDGVWIYLTNDDLHFYNIDIAGEYIDQLQRIDIEVNQLNRALLHEIGHHIDFRLGRPSQSEEFKDLQIKYYDQLRNYTTIDQGEPGSSQGCSEAFADCVDAYLQDYKKAFKRKRGKFETNSVLFKEKYPDLANFIEKKIQEYLGNPLPEDTNYKYVELPDDE